MGAPSGGLLLSIRFSFKLVFSPNVVWISNQWAGEPRGLMLRDSAQLCSHVCSRFPWSSPGWLHYLVLWTQLQDIPGFIQPRQRKVCWDAWWANIPQLCSCLLCSYWIVLVPYGQKKARHKLQKTQAEVRISNSRSRLFLLQNLGRGKYPSVSTGTLYMNK